MFQYYRDELNSGTEGNIEYSIKDSKSFYYKTRLGGKLENDDEKLEDLKIAVPVKYLGRFFRLLRIPLMNCEISLDLKWSKKCVLASRAFRKADPNADPAVFGINNPTAAEFTITHCKLYVPVVTLPEAYEKKLYQMLKDGFGFNIHWKKYRCQIINQRAGLINYLIDPTLHNVSRLFALAFENEE